MPPKHKPVKSKTKRPMTASQRMSARRARLRAEGLRPVQHWVPDLRNARVRAEIRREAALLAQHPDNAVIDDFIDASYDWAEWK
jgi:hypothetical protein